MKKLVVALFVSLPIAPVFAQTKPCDALKTEILAKLEANGVKNYEVEIVPAAEVKDSEGHRKL